MGITTTTTTTIIIFIIFYLHDNYLNEIVD
jgi:hypothetical protein